MFISIRLFQKIKKIIQKKIKGMSLSFMNLLFPWKLKIITCENINISK